MKKKILSQLIFLSFAFAGMFLVGNNVWADPPTEEEWLSSISDETNTIECQKGGIGSTSCSVTWTIGFLGFNFSGGCSTTCSDGYYACCNTDSNSCDCIAI